MLQLGVCGYRVSKLIAIAITVLVILAGVVYITDLYEAKNLEEDVTIPVLAWTVFEIALLIVLIFECRILILLGLIVLFISGIISFVLTNHAVISFAILTHTYINNIEEAYTTTLVYESYFLVVLLVQFVRYLCVLNVYRWLTVTRVIASAGMKNGKITVHTAALP